MEYDAKYDSDLLRGNDSTNTPRPWNLLDLIKNESEGSSNLLDVGCGTAFKTIKLSPFFKDIIGIDPSDSMIAAAKKNISANKINNIQIIKAKTELIPFEENTFDVVTSMVARWDVAEIKRVLKSQGTLLIEHIGCEDKKEFKLFFGKEGNAYRGQFINNQLDEFLEHHKKILESAFNSVTIKNGYLDTYYTIEGLKQLLKYTPTIKNYSEKDDEKYFLDAINHFKTPKGIKLTQNRILIYAKKN